MSEHETMFHKCNCILCRIVVKFMHHKIDKKIFKKCKKCGYQWDEKGNCPSVNYKGEWLCDYCWSKHYEDE